LEAEEEEEEEAEEEEEEEGVAWAASHCWRRSVTSSRSASPSMEDGSTVEWNFPDSIKESTTCGSLGVGREERLSVLRTGASVRAFRG
jgi:hypothetical protein